MTSSEQHWFTRFIAAALAVAFLISCPVLGDKAFRYIQSTHSESQSALNATASNARDNANLRTAVGQITSELKMCKNHPSTANCTPRITVSLPPGTPGRSGIRGATGAPGKPGGEGLRGQRGRRGPRGLPGPAGSPGPTGATGATGAVGAAGVPGSNGLDGKDGETGATGTAGQNGTNGADGKPPASFSFTDEFGTTYVCTPDANFTTAVPTYGCAAQPLLAPSPTPSP